MLGQTVKIIAITMMPIQMVAELLFAPDENGPALSPAKPVRQGRLRIYFNLFKNKLAGIKKSGGLLKVKDGGNAISPGGKRGIGPSDGDLIYSLGVSTR